MPNALQTPQRLERVAAWLQRSTVSWCKSPSSVPISSVQLAASCPRPAHLTGARLTGSCAGTRSQSMRRMRATVTRAPVGPFSHVSRLCAAAGSRPSSVSAPLAHARVGSSTAPLTIRVFGRSGPVPGRLPLARPCLLCWSCATPLLCIWACVAAWSCTGLCVPWAKWGVLIFEYFAHQVHAYILYNFTLFCIFLQINTAHRATAYFCIMSKFLHILTCIVLVYFSAYSSIIIYMHISWWYN